MKLYQLLFGRVQAPLDEGTDLATMDRGDELLPPDSAKDEPEVKAETLDEALKEGEQDDKVAPENIKASEEEEEEEEAEEAKPKKHRQTANERIQELISKNKEKEAAYQAKIKELEEQNSRVKLAENVEEAENKIQEMEEQYANLLADGELKKAAELRKEMRAMERAVVQAQARQEAMQAKEMTKEELKYDTTVSTLEGLYPQINPESAEYDIDVVQEVLALHQGLMSQGLPPSMAIQRAVKYVLGAAAPKEESPKEDRGLQRTKDAKVRNAEAAQRQPASTTKIGADSDKVGKPGGIDIMKMSQDDFAKLSDDSLAKLRGDVY